MIDHVRAWAPGRVNLIGEHTDYSGGLVLPVALQLGVSLDGEARAGTVTLTSDSFGDGEEFAADGQGPAVSGWARLAQAVAAELDARGRPPVGLSGSIRSTLPVGAGLSSSAALEVGVALALCAVAGFELEPLELAGACQRAETRALGVPCGILDPAAALLGRRGAAVLLDCSTLEHRLIPIPKRARFVVADSGEPRRLEASGYARRRAELERALADAGAGDSRSLDEAGLEDLGLDPLARSRLRHVAGENRRVIAFAAALEAGDLEAAGALLLESHHSLRVDYEVSTPTLDELVELAVGNGAHGARLVGGGFGGSVLALVDAGRAEALTEALGAAGHAAVLVEPSDGASVR